MPLENQMVIITGIPVASGIAIGNAFWAQADEIRLERRQVADWAGERKRLDRAREAARQRLCATREKVEREVGAAEAALFDAHMLILDDPELLEMVNHTVERDSINVEVAWADAIEYHARQMDAMENEYFRARAADIRDVGQRVLRLLLGRSQDVLSDTGEPVVILARDLTPSDTAHLDKSKVLGFCTVEGGCTSHTAILAKALNLPAVVGVGKELLPIPNGAPLIVDGERGEIVAYPDAITLEALLAHQQRGVARYEADQKKAEEPAVTVDGHTVKVVANIGGVQEAETALSFGAEGVGLLRTEFLYIVCDTLPGEEEQLAAYDRILDTMGSRPVVVRTLDVGGDKALPFLNLGKESNPFLGYRAIRMCLDRPEFFKVQLRAVLRASPGHDLRIMFPMIATLEELRRAKALLNEARGEVTAAGYAVAETVQVGIMVEIPSVVVMADKFAREVDFFSIGTNDLAMYTMAADRINQKVAHLTDACHPAVLRQIAQVIDSAHRQGIWVGLCGELAGDPDVVPILLGLGLDEFSMASSCIPRVKRIIQGWSWAEAQRAAADALNQDSAQAVRQQIQKISDISLVAV